ncbi:hypothetical protein DICSQDRAFT_182959 [Dichomitus squalens LYAD-421 SS1]|uniref:Zn(2)-C6 fungal-type domain-containing protein n=1 Tax=Dichomitus squalens (strain LYAD-421) TaxID=732165 RepID=R7SP04_DICSQ|nr:uncharacterized protein DICSQDRAFT_182959 [Dichomitus squalens LYAD-421 SS1]EJF57821.1 hypothetical protein DICSQDRAFT_182959 [Dichomitus squalens LYAD-421 SS1]
MATEFPPPFPAQPQSEGSACTSEYDAQGASALFDPLIQQSDPLHRSHISPTSLGSANAATRSSSWVAPTLSRSISAESSSLAGALHLHSLSFDAAVKWQAEASQIAYRPSAAEIPGPGGKSLDESHSSDPTSKKGEGQFFADKPLTSLGKPRERIYLACVQCRTRKVRCDGAKPECSNCIKRADPVARHCSYDPAPRRRRKDRTPGSRHLAPLQPKKTRTTRSRVEEEERRKKALAAQAAKAAHSETHSALTRAQTAHAVQNLSSSRPSHATPSIVPEVQRRANNAGLTERASATSYLATVPSIPQPHRASSGSVMPQNPTEPTYIHYNPDPIEPRDPVLIYAPPEAFELAWRIEEDPDDSQTSVTVWTPPGVRFTRETWWDALLAHYTDVPIGRSMTADNSLHWFAFVNIPRFFASLCAHITDKPCNRVSFTGAKGREKALQLVDQAHAMFDASLSSGWIDVGLVQAAWLLAMFEIQAHPRAATPRTRSAFKTLDSLIRSLSLTTLDIADPRTSTFARGQVPVVIATATLPISVNPLPMALDNRAPALAPPAVYHSQQGFIPGYSHAHSQMLPADGSQWQCGCSSYCLGSNWPQSVELAPAWTCMPMWPDRASEGEVQKEECRRIVWSTVMLTASHSTKTTAGTDREPQHLWIKDPANYALLFPGESLVPMAMNTIPFSKESVWALYMRVLFLWHSALRQRGDSTSSDADRAAYAMGAWLELDNVEACLDRHSCGIQSGFMMQMREVLFNTRMVISNEFRRYISEATTVDGSLFYREKAERWMKYMLGSAQQFSQSFKSPGTQPNSNSRRCFLMYWFMSQIMRGLSLWYADRTLFIALEVAKAFAPCVEFMMMIWPSPSEVTAFGFLCTFGVDMRGKS